MKQIISTSKLLIASVAIALLLAAGSAANTGKQGFLLHNETGVEIHELYVSPHSSGDWEKDILGRDTLPATESVKIVFEDQKKEGKWDLKVVDGNKNSIEWENLDLTKITEVTLHYQDGKAWADVK